MGWLVQTTRYSVWCILGLQKQLTGFLEPHPVSIVLFPKPYPSPEACMHMAPFVDLGIPQFPIEDQHQYRSIDQSTDKKQVHPPKSPLFGLMVLETNQSQDPSLIFFQATNPTQDLVPPENSLAPHGCLCTGTLPALAYSILTLMLPKFQNWQVVALITVNPPP